MEQLMTTVTYQIPSISCMHCVHTIQSEVSELTGVKSVVADAEKKEATITFESPATEAQIKHLLAEINYPAAA
jgi:copper chaperone CopZ